MKLVVFVYLAVTGLAAQSRVAVVAGNNLAICADGLSPGECRYAQAGIKLSLERLKPELSDWRFVVIDSRRWSSTCKRFKLKPCVPAFSDIDQHATYLISTLLVNNSRLNEDLQRYSNLTGQDRLDWVISHELGHILCATANEQVAENAGGKLRYSNRHRSGCKSRKSLASAGRNANAAPLAR